MKYTFLIKGLCFNQMNSLQDDHCAGLSDLYAFETNFPIPQNYEDESKQGSYLNIAKQLSLDSNQF